MNRALNMKTRVSCVRYSSHCIFLTHKRFVWWPRVTRTVPHFLGLDPQWIRQMSTGVTQEHVASIIFKVEVCTFVRNVDTYLTIRRHVPEDGSFLIVTHSPAGERNYCGQGPARSFDAPRHIRSAHVVQTCRVRQNNGNILDTIHIYVLILCRTTFWLKYSRSPSWNGLAQVLNSHLRNIVPFFLMNIFNLEVGLCSSL
jgi:hypothetical protein